MVNQSQAEAAIARYLRSLYFTRAVVQYIWAAAVLLFLPIMPGVTIALLVFYPLFDAACSLYELKRDQRAAAGAKATQTINAAVGGITAVAILLSAGQAPSTAIFAFGAWALAAGVMQIAVGFVRWKHLRGQLAMTLSGLQSAIAGAVLIIHSFSNKAEVKDLGIYAIGGATYFLITALLLLRRRGSGTQIAAA